jgi:hypothetical protein
MSEADNRNTTKVSRRGALAGLAGAAAAGMAALPAGAAAVDPIFAVIAEHRAVFRTLMDALQKNDRAAGDFDEDAAIRIVLTAQPTTIEGVAALLHHVGQHECLGMDSEYEEDRETVLTTWNNLEDERKRIAQDFPLRLAATVRAMAGTAIPRWIAPTAMPAGAAEADPIFAVIAEHRAAVRAYCAAFDEDDEDLVAETGSDHVDALAELVSCRPTTLRGVVALLEHLGEPDYGHDPDDVVLVGAVGWGGSIKASVNELPRVLAETMRGLIGTVPSVQRIAVELDPVYAVIDRERTAFAEFHKFVAHAAEDADQGEDWRRLESVLDEARLKLMRTEPTTIAGVIATLRCAEGRMDPRFNLNADINERRFLRRISDALAKIAAERGLS